MPENGGSMGGQGGGGHNIIYIYIYMAHCVLGPGPTDPSRRQMLHPTCHRTNLRIDDGYADWPGIELDLR